MTMDFVVSDRKLYHLCGVPTSPRWSYCIQKSLYRFSQTRSLTRWLPWWSRLASWAWASTAGSPMPTASSTLPSLSTLSECLFYPQECLVTYLDSCVSMWLTFVNSYLQSDHKPGWDESDDWCLHNDRLVFCSQCFWVLSGHTKCDNEFINHK